ncbi:MAG: helix-turn-helix domain-containing protein [Yoonia sp.]|uniref:helix-turn-helix domain-containing protein n=1 Tax=Yoonia sp. TaxID=2212373 RepID=UPI003EFB1CA5
MAKEPKNISDPPDLYTADPVEEEDLWFLPGPDDEPPDAPYDLPLPKSDQRPLIDLAAWAAAQADLARPLTDLGIRLGRLAARLEQGPEGWQHRLALREAVDLSWIAGDRVPMERLALWLTLRLSGDNDDAQALARAGWAARRLVAGVQPADDLAGFLGRQSGAGDEKLIHQIADWAEVMGQAKALHPITQSCLSFHLWPVVGLSANAGMALPLIEASVVAARHGVRGMQGAPFLPVSVGGAAGLRGGGTQYEQLERWITGATQAVNAALRMLDALDDWDAQARAACAGLSGRTPPQLITLLRDWPLVSAPMAEAQIDASRAAIQRNLNWMTQAGIARETTGQGRYRFWTASVTL